MSHRVRWNSMPRVPRLQDEEDNGWTEAGFEDTNISLSSEDNDRPDGRKMGPNHGTNGCPDETGRIPLIMGDDRRTKWRKHGILPQLIDCETYFIWLELRLRKEVDLKM
ncbi:uncharacterized protein LOC111397521 [Olea europaea var. sylvestris]|uniref:Uncharacterized protein n=1 Tax=Olea europaea subsp. europaea TaxID=158383 RepID=A0A8S0RSN0_OLEEU|nr:uncharacterized protein LOC111397521 [Olea europaea var. sylvestris]CAA2982811.1 Hypothetical predicted protein [Olea europaea subsp. europaea]